MDYSNRNQEEITIVEIDDSAVKMSNGFHIGKGVFPPNVKVGDEFIIETRGFSMVVGVFDLQKNEWFNRKSDQDLEREHEEMVAGFKRRRKEELERNRANWTARTLALPDWLKERVDYFIKNSENFEEDGWGYELAVAELAALYAKYGISTTPKWEDEPEEIKQYAHDNGTSGNQHGMAVALSAAHLRGQSVGGTVSALSPLTGKATY